VNAPRQFDSLERVTLPAGSVHLAIGMFDGVHLGHQSVIEAAVQSARRSGGLAGVLTFWPHPSTVLRPEKPTALILSRDIKRAQLAQLGIDFLVEHPFSLEFAATTARDFVALLKRAFPQLEAVYVGENFRFGRGREGDTTTLIAAAREAGFAVFSAPRLNHNGEPISSSRIRELIAAGEIERANQLLGYSYFSEGTVEQGKRLGRTLGFPTLNLAWQPGLAPRFGVYLVTVSGPYGRMQPGVANYGLRPTVEAGATAPRLEVHVLTATALTYGDRVTVRWLRFLRPERKFSGVEELRKQIEIDRRTALEALGRISAEETSNDA
jgi:riboflavin kinase/FMN adenylyltransferase